MKLKWNFITLVHEQRGLHFQSLTDLENARDDLLYELHKLPNQAPADKIMLKAYFEDVEVLSQLLEKQLRLVLSRTLNTVRKEPTVIVTALRIIEREEKADSFALQVWLVTLSWQCIVQVTVFRQFIPVICRLKTVQNTQS
jgi:hypothetical protein